MIPKIIHYCWLSDDPIPDDLQLYMNTWQKILPDYEIIKWDFSRFNKNSSIWVSQAFDNKKYAFAADYIRLYAIYNLGGIYLDSDVEVLKSFNDYLELPTMIGWQYKYSGLEVAAFGAQKGEKWIKDCLDYYNNREFVKQDGTFDMRVLPNIIQDVLEINNYELARVSNLEQAKKIASSKVIPVFEPFYFSPKSFEGKIVLKKETVTIHHFAASWTNSTHRLLRRIILRIGGARMKRIASMIYRFFYN